MRRYARDIAILGLLFLLPLILFGAQTIGGRTLIPSENLFQSLPHAAYRAELGIAAVPHNALLSDLALQNFQWKSFIRENLAAGEIPLWNPHQFAGIPFLAAGQQSALYPLSILYDVLPLPAAYGWFTVVNLWLAGAFMFLFLRGIGVGRAGGTVGGIVYQLSGCFVASAVFPMIIGAAAWIPLLLLMIEFIVQRRPVFRRDGTLIWLIIGAAALGCSILAGHVEITYYTLLIMAYYAAARLAWLWWEGRRISRAKPLRAVIGRGLWLTALVALGIGLGAVQFVPLFEFAALNFRSGSASYDQIVGWAHPTRDVLQFILPNVYGNPAHHGYFDVFNRQFVSLIDTTVNSLRGGWLTTIDWGIKNYVESALYVGILPLALAAYALLAGRSPAPVQGQGVRLPVPYRWIFLILALLSLSFMFGLPTYRALYALPGIDQLHSPFRWVFALTLCVAALAGIGMDRLLAISALAIHRVAPTDEATGGEVARSPNRACRFIGWLLIAIGGQILVVLAASYVLFPQIEPLLTRVLSSLAEADRAFSDARMFYSYQFGNLAVLALMALGAGGVFILIPPPSRKAMIAGDPASRPDTVRSRAAALLAVTLITLDLLIASWNFNPASDPALLDFTPPAIAWLQAQTGDWRYTTLDDPTQPPLMNANVGWRYGLDDIRGYESIIARQYVDYMQSIAPQTQLDFNRVAPIYTAYPESIPFDYRDALTSPRLDALNVRYVMTHLTTDISDVDGYTLAYEDAAVRIWENTDALPRAYTADGAPVEIVSDSGREILFRASDYFTVSMTHYPGWRAFVRPIDGTEDDELPAALDLVDDNFIGVDVPAPNREWIVRLVYSPQSFQIGLFGSFIAAALLAFALGAWAWRMFVARPDGEGTATERVARNSIAPILLNLFNRGIDFAFALVMLRVLGPEGSGIYTYVVVIFGWFDIISNFGLNLYLIREAARDKTRAAALLANTTILRLGLVGVCAPLLLAFIALRQSAGGDPLSGEAVTALILLYIGLIPGTINTGLAALFYAFERIEVPAAVATLTTMAGAVARLIALLLGFGVVGLAGVSIGANLLTLVVLAWSARGLLKTPHPPTPSPTQAGREGDFIAATPPLHLERGEVRVSWATMRGMMRESWALMLNHLLATIFFQIDVIIIEIFHGERMVGQYGVAYKWLLALNIIPSFFTQALLPVMARQVRENRDAFARTYTFSIKLMLILALPVAVVFTFAAEFLTRVLGGAAFLPDGAIATQMMIWSIPIGWMNSLTQYALIALDIGRRITVAFVAAVTFNIVTNWIFIPIYGYPAAAITTILSELVLFAFFARALRDTIGQPIGMSVLARAGGAAALMTAATAAGWLLHPLIGLAFGGAVYAAAVVGLRLFAPEELDRVLALIPARLRTPARAVLRLKIAPR